MYQATPSAAVPRATRWRRMAGQAVRQKRRLRDRGVAALAAGGVTTWEPKRLRQQTRRCPHLRKSCRCSHFRDVAARAPCGGVMLAGQLRLRQTKGQGGVFHSV